MNVLGVIQRVTKFVGMQVPEAVFSSTERGPVEFGALANQVAETIATDHDWQRLRRLATLTGDGVTTAFQMPHDYTRIPEGTSVRSVRGPLQHVLDHDMWLDWELRAYYPSVYGAWTMLGDRMEIRPVLAAGEVVKFWYQSDRIVRSNGTAGNSAFPYNLPFELADSDEYGYARTSFTSDDDFYQLPWRLLELGIIWQWRSNKGLPYAEDMQAFEMEKARLIRRERGPRGPIVVGGSSYYGDEVDLAYPYTLRAQ